MPPLDVLVSDINTIFSMMPHDIRLFVETCSEKDDGLHLEVRVMSYVDGSVKDVFRNSWHVLTKERRLERWRLVPWAVALLRVVTERLSTKPRMTEHELTALSIALGFRLFEPNPLLETYAFEEKTLVQILGSPRHFGAKG